jgi:hypothetical protein
MGFYGCNCECKEKYSDFKAELLNIRRDFAMQLSLIEKELEKRVDYHIKQFLVNFERELNSRKK